MKTKLALKELDAPPFAIDVIDGIGLPCGAVDLSLAELAEELEQRRLMEEITRTEEDWFLAKAYEEEIENERSLADCFDSGVNLSLRELVEYVKRSANVALVVLMVLRESHPEFGFWLQRAKSLRRVFARFEGR